MTLFAGGLGLILLGGFAARGLQHRPRAADLSFRLGVLLGSLAAVAPALRILVPGSGAGPILAGTWYGLDQLSAWFLLIVLGVGAVVALYGIPYLDPERGHRPVGPAHLLLAILLVALSGVVTARTDRRVPRRVGGHGDRRVAAGDLRAREAARFAGPASSISC